MILKFLDFKQKNNLNKKLKTYTFNKHVNKHTVLVVINWNQYELIIVKHVENVLKEWIIIVLGLVIV